MRLTEREVVERIERVSVRRLRTWVRNGWIAPARGTAGPAYDELDVARIRLVRQLKEDLGVNDDAVPVVLSLIDQLHGARRELRALVEAIDKQPAAVRETVREAYRRIAHG